MEYAIKFEFLRSNNEAENEALILKMTPIMDLDRSHDSQCQIRLRTHSGICIRQVCKEDTMRMYLAKTQEFF